MLEVIETYLALRRATGFAMSSAEYLLKSFAAFAAERGQTHVEMQTAIDWAALGPSVGQRDARLRAVCRFVRHVRVEDIGHELPPPDYFGARKRRRTPHIYTTGEISRLIEAGLRLRPMRGMCPCTQATLIALLSATGLRISEALKLTIADVRGFATELRPGVLTDFGPPSVPQPTVAPVVLGDLEWIGKPKWNCSSSYVGSTSSALARCKVSRPSSGCTGAWWGRFRIRAQITHKRLDGLKTYTAQPLSTSS